MRYHVGENGMVGPAAQSSGDVVAATVWLTFFVGIAFVLIGTRAQQRWLQFWGALTVLCCAAYYLRDWLGFPASL